MTSRLRALNEEVARQLARLGGDQPNWIESRSGIDTDVLVVGGGQSGAALAFALRRAGVGRVEVVDAAEPGEAGVWRTRARMVTLRTVKTISGPELGVPGLTFRAWFEALHGEDAYEALGRIPRETWDDYVAWYRSVLSIPVLYRTRLVGIAGQDDHLVLTLETGGARSRLAARKLVLATGVGGLGAPLVPEIVRANLPPSSYAHTDDAIDFAALAGARIAVLGAASSAFDAAATALERGAASVDLYCRRPTLASWVGPRLMEYAGVAEYFHLLPDLDRWRLIRGYRARGTAPPETVQRATRFPAFRLHLGAPWQGVRHVDGRVWVTANGAPEPFDFVIAGTGYAIDLAARPELAGIASAVATWGDRFVPPPGEEDAGLAAYPYLGHGLEFLEKEPGSAPWLRHIHAFSYGGVLSYGAHVGEVQSLRVCVPAVADAVARSLFLADAGAIVARLTTPILVNAARA